MTCFCDFQVQDSRCVGYTATGGCLLFSKMHEKLTFANEADQQPLPLAKAWYVRVDLDQAFAAGSSRLRFVGDSEPEIMYNFLIKGVNVGGEANPPLDIASAAGQGYGALLISAWMAREIRYEKRLEELFRAGNPHSSPPLQVDDVSRESYQVDQGNSKKVVSSWWALHKKEMDATVMLGSTNEPEPMMVVRATASSFMKATLALLHLLGVTRQLCNAQVFAWQPEEMEYTYKSSSPWVVDLSRKYCPLSETAFGDGRGEFLKTISLEPLDESAMRERKTDSEQLAEEYMALQKEGE